MKFSHLYTVALVLALLALLARYPLSAEEIDEIRIPVYAIDANGNPATGLDQKELKLYLDNAPVPFSLETHDETDRETGKLNIIILDSTLAKYNDFVNGKRIAEKLVNDCPPCDTFAVIQLSPLAGMRLILPPGADKKLALEQINTLTLYPPPSGQYADGLGRAIRDIRSMKYNRSRHYVPRKSHYKSLKEIRKIYRGEYYYETQVLRFSYFLSKFKNALCMIRKPKIVYLLSSRPEKDLPGVVLDSIITDQKYEYISFAGDFLKKLVKEIDESGCLLFNIDTRKQGDTIPAVTSFYQLQLTGTFKPGEKSSIRLSCTRQDIRLSYPRYIVPARSYEFMDNRQKRLFLLDIIMEEPWVKLAAPVEKVPFKIIADSDREKGKAGNGDTLKIKIPGQMYRGEVDVYTLYIDPKTRGARIRFSRLTADNDVITAIDKAKDKHRFFVVVEPAETYCIYNQVKPKKQ
jgi:hypothetical protein